MTRRSLADHVKKVRCLPRHQRSPSQSAQAARASLPLKRLRERPSSVGGRLVSEQQNAKAAAPRSASTESAANKGVALAAAAAPNCHPLAGALGAAAEQSS